MTFAYDLPRDDSEIQNMNLRDAASQVWRGVTALIQGKPYLVIDKDGPVYTLEGEDGKILKLQHFEWTISDHQEADREISAKRAFGKKRGHLSFTEDGWKESSLSGSFTNQLTGESVDFSEKDHFPSDSSVGAHEYWEVQGDDGRTYYVTGDGEVLDENDEVVGQFDPYSDPNLDRGYDTDQEYYASKTAAQGTFQGAVAAPGMLKTTGQIEGIALCPDKQNMLDIDRQINDAPTHQDDALRQRQLIPDWALNRGGSKQADFATGIPPQPKPGQGDPGSSAGQGGIGGPVTWAPEFIVVSRRSEASDDMTKLLLNPKVIGAITETGGATAHAVVMARQNKRLSVIVDAAGIDQINPGDHIRVLQNGVIEVNGGQANSELEQAAPQKARQPAFAFVWVGDQVKTEANHDAQSAYGQHQKMFMEFMNEGADMDALMNGAAGVAYTDGSVDLYQGGPQEKAQVKQWLAGQGYTNVHDIQGEGQEQAVATAAAKGEGKYPRGTRVKINHPKYPSQVGTILEFGGKHTDLDDEKYHILLDTGEDLHDVPETAFDIHRHAGVISTTDEHFLDTMEVTAVSWAPDEDKPYTRGAPRNLGDLQPDESICPNCGQPTYHELDLGATCEHCGEPLHDGGGMLNDYIGSAWTLVEAKEDEHTAALLDSNGNELTVDGWYVMHSDQYRVPDIIKVLELDGPRIEAAIEGDNQGMFPIVITPDEAEKMGYSFEPYSDSNAPETLESTAGWKLARHHFSPTQQRDLINENMEGRARNFDKLNLEGTHYPKHVQSTDDMDAYFLW